jgi:hypothetical protein
MLKWTTDVSRNGGPMLKITCEIGRLYIQLLPDKYLLHLNSHFI